MTNRELAKKIVWHCGFHTWTGCDARAQEERFQEQIKWIEEQLEKRNKELADTINYLL